MTSIATTPSSTSSPQSGRGPLIVGAAIVGLAVVTTMTVPRLLSGSDVSTSTAGSTSVVTTARAGGPDALALHRSTTAGTRTGADAERHFFGGAPAAGSPGLVGPHALDPRAWTSTTSYEGSAYSPGGSVYQQQVPAGTVVATDTDGPRSPDAAERWATGTSVPSHPIPKRGYR